MSRKGKNHFIYIISCNPLKTPLRKENSQLTEKNKQKNKTLPKFTGRAKMRTQIWFPGLLSAQPAPNWYRKGHYRKGQNSRLVFKKQFRYLPFHTFTWTNQFFKLVKQESSSICFNEHIKVICNEHIVYMLMVLRSVWKEFVFLIRWHRLPAIILTLLIYLMNFFLIIDSTNVNFSLACEQITWNSESVGPWLMRLSSLSLLRH